MSHDYDEELGKNTERRSRRNPRLKGSGDGTESADQNHADSMRSGRQEKEIWEKRRRASQKQKEQALDVMGDSNVYPLKHSARTESESSAAKESSSGSFGEGSVIRRQLEAQAAKRKKRRRMITMIVAECIALVFIFGYAYVARLANMIQRPDSFDIRDVETNELNVNTVETMKGYWTIAIFGVDARDNAINKGTNADVNMICNINRDTGEIRLVSVFRDTYLNISEKGSYNKLNQAYFLGGPEQAVQALNRNLDLNINDYMTFNWKAVADAINVLGGIDIELSKAEFYYINSFITETVKATGVGSTQLTHAGMNHLDGVQAVAYGRLRLMDTDYARTERQRKVIALAFEKAKKADFKTLNVLIGTVFPQVSTSIWVDDLVSNAKNISKFHLGETTGFPQARGDANMGKKGAVVVPQTLESNVIKLHEFLFGDTDYTPSQTVKKISAKIAEDTGMYKEGKYVESVSTDGGVIQQPKATKPASTTSSDETEEEQESKKKQETDENGSLVETETDEDGNLIEETSSDKKPGSRPTEAETDEDGNLIEPETDEDGNPVETESRHPSHSETTKESTTADRPMESSQNPATSRPGNTGNGVVDRPGAVTETTGSNQVSPTPGASSTKPTSSGSSDTSGGPGSTSGTTKPSTAPTTSTTPTTSTVPKPSTAPTTSTVPKPSTAPTTSSLPTPTTASSALGSGTSHTSTGPSNQNGSAVSGTVSAPGQ